MQEKKVVVLGGGPATDVTLVGLKRYTSQLTALVSTFDQGPRQRQNGNGAGHPPEHMRSSLLALGADPATSVMMERLFAYRFAYSAGLGSETFGSLLLSTLTEITGAADLALQAAARVLNVQGQVLPVTLQECPLVAQLNDGTEVVVSTPAELIAASGEAGLRHVRLAETASALDAAIDAIRRADIIVLGPADLHFGILAPLQLEGLSEALAASGAVRIFICNMVTQPNTTEGWPASRFIRSVLGHLGGPGSLDSVIVNSAPLNTDVLTESPEQIAAPVHFDLDECLSLGLNVIVRPVASSHSLFHDPEKLARTILFLGGGRSARRTQTGRTIERPLVELPAGGALTPRGAEF
jgi:uncharacterized cofD-like protein